MAVMSVMYNITFIPFSLVDTKCEKDRFCFRNLKNTSISQRLLYASRYVGYNSFHRFKWYSRCKDSVFLGVKGVKVKCLDDVEVVKVVIANKLARS